MTPRSTIPVLVVAALLGGSPVHAARCGLFGTQLECGLGANEVVIGTQVAAEPHPATSSLRPHSFHGSTRLFDDHAQPGRPRIEIQNIGVDPTLCRSIGNESYCY